MSDTVDMESEFEPVNRLRSAVHGILWPAVAAPAASQLLAILHQLDQSQWWPAADLRRAQMAQLRLLLQHARATVPYYRDRLAGIGRLAGVADDSIWRRLPLLNRADIQAAGNRLISESLPPGHGNTGEIFTSGSTGKPIRAVQSDLWRLYWSAFTVRDHLWHRRDLGGKLAGIRETGAGKAPYPRGSRGTSWGRASGILFSTGPHVSLNATTSVEQQLDWLQREDPDYLLTHPSIVHRLATLSLERGVRLPRLRAVETISEILRPLTRELCRAAWGVPVTDLYTTREAGYIALQCPEHEHYHVQSEGILVEVLDESDRPCRPGALGRVVVTPLHNFAMPLIRYEIGDVAEVGDACPCGRGLPVLRRIIGRSQNMLVLPSGERRWPLLSSADIRALLALAPIRQYQCVQTEPSAIELRLSIGRSLQVGEEEALRRWVVDKFGHPFDVKLSYHDSLAAGASGKFEDFVCRVPVPGP